MTLKLLLVGKKIANFQAIKDTFDNEDVVIITATSMALALFLARKNQPDLIISQEQLVDSNGLDFLYELRNEDELAKIPFALFLTDKKPLDLETNNVIKKNIPADPITILYIKDMSAEDVSNLREKILALLNI